MAAKIIEAVSSLVVLSAAAKRPLLAARPVSAVTRKRAELPRDRNVKWRWPKKDTQNAAQKAKKLAVHTGQLSASSIDAAAMWTAVATKPTRPKRIPGRDPYFVYRPLLDLIGRSEETPAEVGGVQAGRPLPG